jgi:hypothetical protein
MGVATVRVRLTMAWGPAAPEHAEAHRMEFAASLDPQGCPDAEAWRADPAPWPARRIYPDGRALDGDVQHDPDHGWSLRFFGAGREAPDVAPLPLVHAGPIRPGEVLTLREPEGGESAWRVVEVA